MALVFPEFVPRFPWVGGDLQTLRNFLARPRDGLDRWPSRRVEIPVSQGDRLIAELHHPESDSGKPPVVLVHGLTGLADSPYMRLSATELLAAGRPVLRLNLRGAGPSMASSVEFYHAGRSEDLAAAFAVVGDLFPGRGMHAVGYSLGANMLLKYLGEAGASGLVRAAIAISAPIDLLSASARINQRRNRLYHDYLLRRMRVERGGSAAALTAAERAAVREARTILMFDDRVIAPRNGFAGAEDYYIRCSGRRFLGAIRVPTLIIHATDDPWIPEAPYRAVDWRANPNLIPLLPEGGGHVGFHAAGDPVPWYDRCIVRFLDSLSP